MVEIHAFFHGNVHGVGFRATAKQFANRLQITGYVRNVPDGTVELCAQGERKNLDHLLELLKNEFAVQRIDSAYRSIETPFPNFKIL
jgi:acylphosphatase